MGSLVRLSVASCLALLASAATPGHPIDTVAIDGDLPAFVVRPVGSTRANMVFLHGRCEPNPKGFVETFAIAASTRGTLIAPQGDVACGNGPRKWSGDLDKL